MAYFVYMLKCVSCKKKRTYIGYTNNVESRVLLHNIGKGAKFTKGNKWKLIYKKKFLSKSKAMSYEYSLKNDKVQRLKIYNNS